MDKTGKKSKNNQGFTLVEILVAAGIFTIASLIIGAIFVNANNMQLQSSNMQRLQNEARYIIEKIAKEIRGRELDISGSLSQPDTLVFFPDETLNTVTIEYSGSDLIYNLTDPAGQTDSAVLNAADVIIEEAKFFIKPVDSYDPTQPRVTLLLRLKNQNANKFQRELTIQTTISSKNYKK